MVGGSAVERGTAVFARRGRVVRARVQNPVRAMPGVCFERRVNEPRLAPRGQRERGRESRRGDGLPVRGRGRGAANLRCELRFRRPTRFNIGSPSPSDHHKTDCVRVCFAVSSESNRCRY
jgi:hypothetical protein